MDPAERIRVLVAYAMPEQQSITPVDVPAGSTALDAVHLSGVLGRYPEIASSKPLELAVFGRKVQATTPVRPGDRVEILRPLGHDPKEKRRQLAGRGQTMGRKAPP